MRTVAIKLSRLAVLAVGVCFLPSKAWAQTCPDANSHTTATVTVTAADGSTVPPPGTVPFGIYRNGALLASTYIATGGAEVQLGGMGNGTTTTYTFVAGGNDYFQSPITTGASCTQTATGGGGCTVSCTGSATIKIYSNHGSYQGKVTTFPKDRVQGLGYTWADAPGIGQNFSTLADGTFNLAISGLNPNWVLVLRDVGGQGRRTANFFVSSGSALGVPTPFETKSNENAYVKLSARAPYYAVPCGGSSRGGGRGSPG